MKKYTSKEWVKIFGKEHNIKAEEVLRQRCRGTEIRGRIYPLPYPWKCVKEGRQWFMYREGEDTTLPEDVRKMDSALREAYLDAGIDDYTISQLISMAKEAIITGKAKRLLLEFQPSHPIRNGLISSNCIAAIPVEQVFDKRGKEIGSFTPDLNERLQSIDYWHLFVHKQWLMFHAFNQDETYRKEELQKVISRHVPSHLSEEIENQVHRHCLWCGCVKRDKSPNKNKRLSAKFCTEDECKPQFKRWLKKIYKFDQYEKKIKIEERMAKIRAALST